MAAITRGMDCVAQVTRAGVPGRNALPSSSKRCNHLRPRHSANCKRLPMKTLRLLQSAEDSGPLHLPLQGLYADLDMGRGSVRMTDEFATIAPSLQAEVLQDWMQALEQLRRRALTQIYRDMSARCKDLPATERVAAFRSSCEQAGLEVPPDLAIVLQHARGGQA